MYDKVIKMLTRLTEFELYIYNRYVDVHLDVSPPQGRHVIE